MMRREPETHRHTERERERERDEEDVVFSKDSVSCISLGFLPSPWCFAHCICVCCVPVVALNRFPCKPFHRCSF